MPKQKKSKLFTKCFYENDLDKISELLVRFIRNTVSHCSCLTALLRPLFILTQIPITPCFNTKSMGSSIHFQESVRLNTLLRNDSVTFWRDNVILSSGDQCTFMYISAWPVKCAKPLCIHCVLFFQMCLIVFSLAQVQFVSAMNYLLKRFFFKLPSN